MIIMKHFKHKSCAITFIGYDTDKHVYSLDYYANVGLINCEESTPVTLKEVKALIAYFQGNAEYTQVSYLKEVELYCASIWNDREDEEICALKCYARDDGEAEQRLRDYLKEIGREYLLEQFPILTDTLDRKTYRKKLSNEEYNALSTLTHNIKVDGDFDVIDYNQYFRYYYKLIPALKYEDAFMDFENNVFLSLKDGLQLLSDSLGYEVEHDIDHEQAVIIEKLFKEFDIQ